MPNLKGHIWERPLFKQPPQGTFKEQIPMEPTKPSQENWPDDWQTESSLTDVKD